MINRIVFVLGAGASKEAGAPLMREFLDVAELIREEQTGETRDKFNLVFKAIAELQAIYAKSFLELDNIESVFAAFEMVELFGRLGNMPPEDIQSLISAIKSLIVSTLESRIMVTVSGERLLTPKPYGQFVEFVSNLVRPSNTLPQTKAVSLMTFNYDLALDAALYMRGCLQATA